MNDNASGIFYNPLLGFLYHYITTLLFFIIFNIFLSKRILQSLSQSYPREIRDKLFNFRTTIVSFALVDNSCDNGSCPEFNGVIVTVFSNII